MAKAKKEVKVDLDSFHIHKVDNGWTVEAYKRMGWFDLNNRSTTHVFNDLDDLLIWIESNLMWVEANT